MLFMLMFERLCFFTLALQSQYTPFGTFGYVLMRRTYCQVMFKIRKTKPMMLKQTNLSNRAL